MKTSVKVQLADLVDMDTPAAVFEEVKRNFILQYPVREFGEVRQSFKDFNALYEGSYPGYRACNTKFHDKIHTTDALIAISRIIDGYNLKHKALPAHAVKIALIATIMHDTGYLQKSQDTKGTGAKYTIQHVDRSCEFIEKYFKKIGLAKKDSRSAQNMVHCTGLGTKLSGIKFSSSAERTLGFMLGTADLLGQMSSRTYLERLLYLYREFKEGHVKGYKSEFELLQKTLHFHAAMKIRLDKDLNGSDKYVKQHFKKRYSIDENLYDSAIKSQIVYLKEILNDKTDSYRHRLRRHL